MLLLNDLVKPVLDPRVYKEAKSLIKAGHDVYVVCWPRGLDLPKTEEYDGIHVIRVFSKLGKMKMKGGLREIRFLGVMRDMVEEAMKIRPDVVHAHDLTTLPVGVAIKKLLRIPLVYDSHECFYLQEVPKGVLISKSADFAERLLARSANYVLTVSGEIARRFEGMGADTTVLYNSRSAKDFSGAKRARLGAKGDFIIGYIGQMSQHRGVDNLVRSMKYINGKNIRVVFLGGPADEMERARKLASREGVSRSIIFIDSVPFKQVLGYIAAMDVGVVPFLPYPPDHNVAAPNKIFELMGGGLPLLVSDLPEMGRIVSECGCGVTFDPKSPKDLAAKIGYLAKNGKEREAMARNSAKAHKNTYCWELQEKKLIHVYRKIEREFYGS
jgi:glycosyltransferase involved in cell wall biosynthesis